MRKILAAMICLALLLCTYGCNADNTATESERDHVSESEIENNASVPEQNGEDENSEPEYTEEGDVSAPEEESAVLPEESDVLDESEMIEEESEDVPSEKADADVKDDTFADTSVPDTDKTETCSHDSTKQVNVKKATCEKDGYSGDVICNDCGKTIQKGSVAEATGHINTRIINTKVATTKQEGYTGDTYCYDCERIIETGIVIDKVVDNSNKATYTLPDGSKITIDKDENIRDYLLHLYTQYIKHSNDNVEKEILRLVNIEREKAGVAPLAWNEDGYFFTEIRAEECCELFSHTRPNGSGCETVYSDSNILLSGYWGENLGRVTDNTEMTDEYLAQLLVNAWMNSTAHKANILNEHYTSISIAYVHMGGYHIVVQNFFGE